jgi:hypothetical protein
MVAEKNYGMVGHWEGGCGILLALFLAVFAKILNRTGNFLGSSAIYRDECMCVCSIIRGANRTETYAASGS